MPYYAQINSNGIVSCVTEAHSAIDADHMVLINELDESLLGRAYDAETGVFGDPPAPPAPEWEWFIDIGPFADRLGPAAAAIDLATIPGLVAVRADFGRRKWIDLQDPRVMAAVRYLAGDAHPQLGTLQEPLITQQLADFVLETKPEPAENLALRKLYFS